MKDKTTIKAIKRVNRLNTLGLDLRTRSNGKPKAGFKKNGKVNRRWKSD